jgi:hypothetical protein
VMMMMATRMCPSSEQRCVSCCVRCVCFLPTLLSPSHSSLTHLIRRRSWRRKVLTNEDTAYEGHLLVIPSSPQRGIASERRKKPTPLRSGAQVHLLI